MTTSPSEELLTVDELASLTGLSVRTTRYYAGLGLLPPPIRQGRVARYDATHRARLELIRALQDHGFTLQAIERYLSRIPLDAGVDDLAVQRAMLRPWQGDAEVSLTRRELESRAGRALSDAEVDRLVTLGVCRRQGDRFSPQPAFEAGVAALDLDIPEESFVEAAEAIERHMDALVDDLTEILRRRVVAPYRDRPREEQDPAAFEHTMATLRRITLEGVVSGFQRAANQVIQRSLLR
ncbi:MerR family transcriptional regulator [Alteromonas gracilis]